MEVGQSYDVEIEISRGGFSTPDIAGYYWATEQAVPAGAPLNGVLTGEATLVVATSPNVARAIRVDLDDYGIVEFSGPISCM